MNLFNILKILVDKFLSIFNLKISRLTTINSLNADLKAANDKLANITSKSVYDLIHKIPSSLLNDYVRSIHSSKSQFAQDLFVLTQLGFKKNGFFIEFGASHPIIGSNTYLLENGFQWSGILAEPSKECHDELLKNRNVFVEKNCVWHTSDVTLSFIEHGVLSTIEKFKDSDMHSFERQKGIKYMVNTISLEDLLDKYNAPRIIDYMSIDTEGSEYEILRNFNFEKYKFRVITCEHNFTEYRKKIFELLVANGYKRKYTDISKADDWYTLNY